ncbi:MAG: nitrate reductase molybdenum cofactor assembly chaperone [Tetrasphaera sp.]
MLWRRHRGSRPSLPGNQIRTTWQLASLLIDYPTEDLVCRVPALRAALGNVPEPARGHLSAYLDLVVSTPLAALQADYVDTFDVTRRCALHLTYYTYGDTRKRGVELVRVKQAYRGAGVEVSDAELPDHLAVILEFGAQHDLDIAWKLLCDNRVGIELLHRALTDRSSRWLPVLAALRATLPVLDGSDEEALARLIAEGPPSEDVGLEPYALGPTIPVGAHS